MAVTARLRAPQATQDDHASVLAMIESRLAASGGPPAGLLVHTAYPEGKGFVILSVWSNEAAFRVDFEEMLRPIFHSAGIAIDDPTTAPTWSLVRP